MSWFSKHTGIHVKIGGSVGKALNGIGNAAWSAEKGIGHTIGNIASNPWVQRAAALGLGLTGVGAPAAAGIMAAIKGGGALLKPGGNIGQGLMQGAQGAIEGYGASKLGSMLRGPGGANMNVTPGGGGGVGGSGWVFGPGGPMPASDVGGGSTNPLVQFGQNALKQFAGGGGGAGNPGFPFELNGGKTWNTQTQSLDQNTKNQLNGIYGAYQAAGKSGPGPLLTGAGQYGTNAMNGGNLGLGALGGDAASVQRLMNPYISGVIDQNNALWQKQNLQTQNQVSDTATKAGAFGGGRYGVALGQALSNNNAQQAAQNAQLLSGGYNQAMNQASQLAQFGYQGAGLNSQLGFAGVGDPSLWYANMIRQGYIQPTGSTTGQTGTNVQGAFGGSAF